MSKIQAAMDWAVRIASDSSHGYDQNSRWGPDYDCSSLVISAWEAAGVPVKTGGATYTGNMKSVFLKTGFSDVTKQVNLATGAGLQAGDVLLHEKNHTAMYIGGGRIVHASINEKGTIKGGAVGDQTGGEICTRSYYNYPWDCVLRYGESGTGEEADYPSGPAGHLPSQGEAGGKQAGQLPSQGEAGEKQAGHLPSQGEASDGGSLPLLRKGQVSGAVLSMQLLLIHKWAISCGVDGADGDFGANTLWAVMAFQKAMGLDTDGICGPMTWNKLIN